MTAARKTLTLGLTTLAFLTATHAASAQWIKKPSDLDPFNKNSAVRKTGREIDNRRLDEMEGTPYTFSIENPNKGGVLFRINDKPYLVPGGKVITIRGRGTPTITFDYGRGDGSFRKHTLSSGQSYVFRWNKNTRSADGPMNLLEIYKKR